MPFGLTNVPTTFQKLMNQIFLPHLRRFILVFFDDILIYSKTWKEHLRRLETTFNILTDQQWFIKKSKCRCGQMSVTYLGYLITRGVKMDADKLNAIIQWSTPLTVRACRGFLGLTGYYRRFIRGYGVIASPLNALVGKKGFV